MNLDAIVPLGDLLDQAIAERHDAVPSPLPWGTPPPIPFLDWPGALRPGRVTVLADEGPHPIARQVALDLLVWTVRQGWPVLVIDPTRQPQDVVRDLAKRVGCATDASARSDEEWTRLMEILQRWPVFIHAGVPVNLKTLERLHWCWHARVKPPAESGGLILVEGLDGILATSDDWPFLIGACGSLCPYWRVPLIGLGTPAVPPLPDDLVLDGRPPTWIHLQQLPDPATREVGVIASLRHSSLRPRGPLCQVRVPLGDTSVVRDPTSSHP